MVTRRHRLRGTSVPAGEQTPSQLPSFLSDTHLLNTPTWQSGPPQPPSPESQSYIWASFPDLDQQSGSGWKTIKALEVFASTRFLLDGREVALPKISCQLQPVWDSNQQLWVTCFRNSYGPMCHISARKHISLGSISKHIQKVLHCQLKYSGSRKCSASKYTKQQDDTCQRVYWHTVRAVVLSKIMKISQCEKNLVEFLKIQCLGLTNSNQRYDACVNSCRRHQKHVLLVLVSALTCSRWR